MIQQYIIRLVHKQVQKLHPEWSKEFTDFKKKLQKKTNYNPCWDGFEKGLTGISVKY